MPVYNRESFPGRVFYASSGNVKWDSFLLWLLVALCVSGMVALAMFGLYVARYYLVLIVPIFAAIIVAVMVKIAIAQGHCRSVAVGVMASILCGTVAYGGYFYCGMVYHWGPRAAMQPYLLPWYIKARMSSDVFRGSDESWEDAAKHRSPGMNWFNFALGGGMIFGLGVIPGIQRPRKPYCEYCGRWMKRHVTAFHPNQGAVMLNILRTGANDQLAAFCAQPVYATVPNLTLGVDICPSVHEGVPRGCPVYISLKQVAQAQPGVAIDPIDQAKGTLLLRCLQANFGELLALSTRFRSLAPITGYAAPPATQVFTQSPPGMPGPSADIRRIDGEPAGIALSRGTLWKCALLGFIPLLFFFGGIVAAIAGFEMAPKYSFGIPLAVTGIASFLAGALWASRNLSVLGTRHLRNVLRKEINQRTAKIVDPNHPDAMFVEVVPKTNWGRVMLDTASDIGYLRFDLARREILFEGDRERYRIPVDALTYIGVEHYVHGQGAGALTYYFVVLRIDHGRGFWEAPVRQRTPGGPGHAERRRLEIMRMYDTIQQMRAGAQASAAAT